MFRLRLDDILASVGIDYDLGEAIQRRYRRIVFNKKQQLEFIEDFETWLEDSGNVRRACDAIIKSKEDIGAGDKPEARAAKAIREAVVSGHHIAEGMAPWFDEEVITVFATGEKTDSLKEMIADYMKLEEELEMAKKEFIKANLYPTIVFVLLLIVCTGFANQVMPSFAQMLPIEKWPAESKAFVAVYQSLGQALPWIVSTLIAFAIYLRWFIRNGTGPIRRRLQTVFPFSIYTYLSGMRVIKMMGLLVGRLYNPRKAAFEVGRTSQPFIKWHLEQIAEREASGQYTFAQSFNTGLMPTRTIQRMEATSALGGSDSKLKALKKAGERSGREAFLAMAKSKKLVTAALYGLALGQLLFLLFAFFSMMTTFMTMV